jgi:hypothetical protein
LAHATFNEIQQEISHGFTGVGDREVGRMDERAANWIGGSINSGFAQNIGVGGTRMTCVELRLDIIRCSTVFANARGRAVRKRFAEPVGDNPPGCRGLNPTREADHRSVMRFQSASSFARPPASASDSHAPMRSNRAIAAAYSPRRYLHIEAIFVFTGRLDHLSVASG